MADGTSDGPEQDGRDTVAAMTAPDVATVLGAYLDVVDDAAPGLVEGLYVVGSYALDDWLPGCSDIDIVAVTAEPCTDEDAGNLRTAHALLAERHPLPHVDGPYVAWGDLVVEPATGLHRPWVLQGVLHHDGDCFEINPVTWYVLDRHAVTVRGPDPSTLGIPTDTEARIRFVVDNLRGYWAGISSQLRTALGFDEVPDFDAASFVWCALGALRLHHTAFTGGVVSKRAAGLYGLEVTPAPLHPALQAALSMRADGERGTATPAAMAGAASIIEWVVDDVEQALDRGN